MLNNVYTLYNSLSCRYGDVVAFPTDRFAITRLSDSLGERKQEIEVCRIGTLDISTGVLTPMPPVRISWNDDSPVESKAD